MSDPTGAELVGIADRILVMLRGRIVAEARAGETSEAALLLAVLANGLLLTGISFYWQQVATGLLILAVLAVSARRTAP